MSKQWDEYMSARMELDCAMAEYISAAHVIDGDDMTIAKDVSDSLFEASGKVIRLYTDRDLL